MFKKPHMTWKLQQPSQSNQYFLKNPTTLFRQTAIQFQPSVGTFLNSINKRSPLFFTYNLPHRDYGYQQRCISTNKMDLTEWQILLKKLRDNDISLTKLNLTYNNIGDAGVTALAATLKDNRSLLKLDLSSNNIGDAGAKELAIALKGNRSLLKLDLSSNNIGDAGVKELAIALKDNRSLIVLDLEHNEINDVGAKEFVTTLSENRTLMILSLRAWNIRAHHWKVGTIVDRDERISDAREEEIGVLIKRNCELLNKMHEAVKKGDISSVNEFMRQGVSLLAISDYKYIYRDTILWGDTALHWAVIAQQGQMTTHLLQLMRQQELPLDTRNSDNKTAAELAQGTELEALFTSDTTIMPPLQNENSEITAASYVGYTPKSKL